MAEYDLTERDEAQKLNATTNQEIAAKVTIRVAPEQLTSEASVLGKSSSWLSICEM